MAYGPSVRRFLNRLTKPAALLLVAAQLLLVFPAVSTAHAASAAGTHVACEQMGGAPHHDGCPCCPDGTSSMKDCLVMCTLAAAITPSSFIVAVTPSHATALTELVDPASTLCDPPLKPPPIA
jgi:hypothetical protein